MHLYILCLGQSDFDLDWLIILFFHQTLQDKPDSWFLHAEDQIHTTELSWQTNTDYHRFPKAGGTVVTDF